MEKLEKLHTNLKTDSRNWEKPKKSSKKLIVSIIVEETTTYVPDFMMKSSKSSKKLKIITNSRKMITFQTKLIHFC